MLEAKSAIVVSCEKKIFLKRDPFFRGQLELSSFEFRGHLRTIQDPLIISLLFKVVLRGQIITYIRGHSRTISYLYWKVRGQMRTNADIHFLQFCPRETSGSVSYHTSTYNTNPCHCPSASLVCRLYGSDYSCIDPDEDDTESSGHKDSKHSRNINVSSQSKAAFPLHGYRAGAPARLDLADEQRLGSQCWLHLSRHHLQEGAPSQCNHGGAPDQRAANRAANGGDPCDPNHAK